MGDYWLKALGSAAKQLPDDWRRVASLEKSVMFARRPQVSRGDKVVYYASGTGVVFAYGEVVSQPYRPDDVPPELKDWPWFVDVQLERSCDYLRHGAPLAALSVGDRNVGASMRRRSHIRLTVQEYNAAVQVLNLG